MICSLYFVISTATYFHCNCANEKNIIVELKAWITFKLDTQASQKFHMTNFELTTLCCNFRPHTAVDETFLLQKTYDRNQQNEFQWIIPINE